MATLPTKQHTILYPQDKSYTYRYPNNSGYLASENYVDEKLTLYQPLLVSGTNIKTINGTTILGSGDLVVSGGVPYTGATANVNIGSYDFYSRKIITTDSITSATNIYAGDKSNTYASYCGFVAGGATKGGFLDFWHNGSRIAQFATTATFFQFFTDSGKELKFYVNNSFTKPLIWGKTNKDILFPENCGVGLPTATSIGARLHVECASASSSLNALKITMLDTTDMYRITADKKMAWFNATPVVRQTGGVLTAGATYTSNEQTMLQNVFTALQNYGLIT